MIKQLGPIIPWLLGLAVVVTSLRGLSPAAFLDEDAPRHALNGALVYDLVRTGNIRHPMAYAKQFYARFPAISLPYHPPVFPVIESVSYAIFGVNMFGARLPVALAAGVCSLLLYRLVERTHRSAGLAMVATLTFMTLPLSQMLAKDVMLEFPSLAFALGALYCLPNMETGYPAWRAIPFALLAGTAVWTKQHTVFLGLVPFLLIVLRGNWRMLLGIPLWISTILLGLMIMALLSLSVPVQHVGVSNQFAPANNLWPILIYNGAFYAWAVRAALGPIVAGVTLVATVAFLVVPRLRHRTENHLYLAWIIPLVPLLVLTTNIDQRYLLYALPPLIVLGYDGLVLACSRLFSVRQAFVVTLSLGACLILNQASWSMRIPAGNTSPFELARTLKDRESRRVVYCGAKNTLWSLAAAMRFLNADSRTILIRGDKLNPSVFAPEDFEEFAHRFGVDTIVIQPPSDERSLDGMIRTASSQLLACPSPSMVRAHLEPDLATGRSKVWIFDFTNPSSKPESVLEIPISFTNGSLKVEL